MMHSSNEIAGSAKLCVRGVFRKCIDEYRSENKLSPVQAKAVKAILACRTKQMGANATICPECGHVEIHYNSCRNRNCPQCQSASRTKWLLKRMEHILDVDHLHIVLTVPSTLHQLALANDVEFYNALFYSASTAVLRLCADEKYLGAKPGITAILHTWGQKMDFHPHIHMAVTHGGIDRDGEWRKGKRLADGSLFLVPVRALSSMFKSIMLGRLRKMYRKGKIHFDAKQFEDALKAYDGKDWVAYCKKPFGGTRGVFEYFGNYTHRIAISNRRILKITDTETTFRYRDYSEKDASRKQKKLVLKNEEFVRRFLMHVVPQGFMRIRHYGIYSSPYRQERETVAELLGIKKSEEELENDRNAILKPHPVVHECPVCHRKETIIMCTLGIYPSGFS